VSDTSSSRTAPTGTVSFSTSSSGIFSSSNCTLAASTSSAASCSVNYTPGAVGSGFHTVTASYSGGSTHASGVGSSSLTVTSPVSTAPLTIFGLSPIVFYSIVGAVVIIILALVVVALRRRGRVSQQ
jgi:hypothetical protein